MKKLFLTSGGFASYPSLRQKYIELIGKKPEEIKILFLSTFPFIEVIDDTQPLYMPQNILLRQRISLIEAGLLPKNLVNHFHEDEWTGNIKDFDAVLVNGGGGKYEKIKKNFRSHIDELVNNNGVYSAISGGSFLALSFSPDVFGYIDCKFDVHCDPGYPAGLVDKAKKDVIGLANNQALIITGDEWLVAEEN